MGQKNIPTGVAPLAINKMKSARDPRHKKRQEIVKQLFAHSFTKQDGGHDVEAILKKSIELDKLISEAAPAWPIDKINKIDLAVLRLATFELEKEVAPPKVIIDEAVELAKEFGGENSPAFINRVLGNILRKKEGKEIKEITRHD